MAELCVVFAVMGAGQRVLTSTRNLIAAAQEDVRVELVCFGDGIALALANGAAAGDVAALMALHTGSGGAVNVAVSACRNTLAGRGLDAQTDPGLLVPGVRVVPAGVLRVALLQRDHWSYLSV